MTERPAFTVVVGLDGSPEARAAAAGAAAFPWPVGTRIRCVVARRTRAAMGRPRYVKVAFDRVPALAGARARARLARTWSGATVTMVDRRPVDALLRAVRDHRARVVVVGSRRRRGAVRLLLGSVSRRVVRRAPCSVLIVRGAPREFKALVIGVDGSPAARRAVSLVTRLAPPRGARVLVVSVVRPARHPTGALVPRSIRALAARHVAAADARAVAVARRRAEACAATLLRAGWRARALVRLGQPLPELIDAVADSGAQLLVVGARGVGAVERMLLGSVAEGALDHAPVSVLIAR
jgi:nucleotide-binding universal stress UspA family protein